MLLFIFFYIEKNTTMVDFVISKEIKLVVGVGAFFDFAFLKPCEMVVCVFVVHKNEKLGARWVVENVGGRWRGEG